MADIQEHKIVILGDIGTGKTSFVKRVAHGIFSIHYKASVGQNSDYKVMTRDGGSYRFNLCVIGGGEKFGLATRFYYEKAIGCFIFVDITRENTFDGALSWVSDFQVKHPMAKHVPIYLMISKIDLIPKGDSRNFEISQWILKYGHKFTKIFRVSSKDGVIGNHDSNIDINNLDTALTQMLDDIQKPTIITPQVENKPFVAPPEIKTHAQQMKEKGVKILIEKIMHEIEAYPEAMKYDCTFLSCCGLDSLAEIKKHFRDLGYRYSESGTKMEFLWH